MYLLYSVIMVAFFAVMSPYLVYQAVRYRKYVASLPPRLG
jgi:3-deoxy-D-manno-octulosonic-acid transferase